MAKKLAMIFGAVFVVVGLLGLVSNPVVGANGIFKTNLVHDIVHIALGVLLLVAMSKGDSASAMCMKIVGVIYLLVAFLGFTIAKEGSLLGLVDVNTADNYLHVVLALVLLGASMMKGSETAMPSGGMGGAMPGGI